MKEYGVEIPLLEGCAALRKLHALAFRGGSSRRNNPPLHPSKEGNGPSGSWNNHDCSVPCALIVSRTSIPNE